MATPTFRSVHDLPAVPVPAGARADEWQDDSPQPYRVLFGALRAIDGIHVDRVSVQGTAIQFPDGRVDDGGQHEPPHVYLGDEALSIAQARALAATLNAAADEADRWAK
jgi:hypothetical protein